MRYISTRGEAPIRDFAGVLLAGLAEDGGLYVPEVLAALLAGRLAGDARPAVPRARRARDPAVRRRRDPVRHARSAVPRRLCRLRPSRRRAIGPARHRPVRAGAVPRPDALVQGHGAAAARPPVRPRAGGPRCTRDDRRRHLGRHRLGGDRGMRRARPHRHRVPAPAWSHQRGAAPPDDHGCRAERRQHRDRGHVRRLPGPGEGDVRRCAVSPGDASLGDELDQLGAHRRTDPVLRRRGAGAGRAGSRGGVQRADRQFRQCARRLGGASHGAAGGAADRWFQSQRHPGAVPGVERHVDRARWSRACRPAWTSRSVPTSSACCSNCWSAMRAPLPPRWRSSAAPGRWRCPTRRGIAAAPCSTASGWTMRAPSRRSPGCTRSCGYLADPHTAIGIAAAEANPPGHGVPTVAMATAHPAKFPEAIERVTGHAPRPAAAARRSVRPARALHRAGRTTSPRWRRRCARWPGATHEDPRCRAAPLRRCRSSG